jgi:hypothetical protein
MSVYISPEIFPDRDGVEEASVAKANLIASVSISDEIINENKYEWVRSVQRRWMN